MVTIRGLIRAGFVFLITLGLVIGLANLVPVNDLAGQIAPAAATTDPKLPDWIQSISPTGDAEPLAQIRVRFKEPLIPVEAIDTPNQKAILSKFQVSPALAGEFRFLTPQMVGFQAAKALPPASRIQVTLKAGLADLKNQQLTQDLVWSFTTTPIALSNFPGKPLSGFSEDQYYDDEAVDLKPSFRITSNVELDLADLRSRLKLVASNNGRTIPLDVVPYKDDSATPQAQFDESQRSWQYDVTPRRTLEKGTTYRLEASPGLRSTQGNLPSTTAYASQFNTYALLAFESLSYIEQPGAEATFGRFTKGSAQLVFNNPLDSESITGNITVSPAPKQGIALLQAYDESTVVNLNPYALEPNTSYTITIGKAVKDKFGQTLGKAVTVQYQTGDVAADIWTPDGLNIFPTNKKDLQLNISAVNLPDAAYRAAYKVLKPTNLIYVDTNRAYSSAKGILPAAKDWKSFPLKGQTNRTSKVTVNLQQQLGSQTGMLVYGVRARTNSYRENGVQKWREGNYFGMVQVTNLGVFAQWFPRSGLVRISHLSDGAAVANAAVEIYESKVEAKERPQPVPCATGKTDRTGVLNLSQSALSACMKGKSSFETAPNLLVIVREGQDWAFTRTEEYSGSYGYGVFMDWQGTKPLSRGVMFSDRQLYQPGETAYITGIAYYLKDGKLQRDANATYTVKLEAPDGKVTSLGSQTTTEFGTFSVNIPLASSQALGFYSLQAKSDNGVEITGDFRVAEFKPPNFKTELALSGGIQPGTPPAVGSETAEPDTSIIATVGQKIQADVSGNYLFGAPVEGGKVDYYITRRRTSFTPAGWDRYAFGRQWFWPQEEPQVPTEVLQAVQALDRQGRNSQQVPVTEIPYPMTYRVDAQIADVSNLSVSDSKSFIALPVDKLIGVQSEFVGEAGKPLAVQVIVTDPRGRTIVGERIRVELQSMTYSRITRVIEGSRSAQNQVEFKTVATAEVRSGDTAQTVNLVPTIAGSYRIRASVANARDELGATDSQVWVTGSGVASWSDRYTNNRLDIQLDKPTYKPGDTATALIQSPYPEADLYFAVIRQNVIYQTIVPVKGGAPQVQFTVTPEMLPNAAVEAVLVRRGQPLEQLADGSLKNLVKVGFTPFTTDLSDRYLRVDLQATPSLKPGDEQTVQLALKDAAGKPAQGQFTVMVVNEAVLQLTGYRPPNLIDTVYASQDITTRFADNRPDVVLAKIPSPLDKGWGYGGGFSKGLGNTRLRTDFKPIAYYNAAVPTNASGQATVKFKLPDNLTTWRVMAVAVSDLRCQVSGAGCQVPEGATNPCNLKPETCNLIPLFGNGETTFITTQPVLANPVLPQFARPGDRFLAGIALTNTTGQAGNAAITAEVENGIQFDDGKGNTSSQQAASLKVAGTGTQLQAFPVVATTAGDGKLRFAADLNGVGDALEVSLPVKPLEVTEQSIAAGSTEDSFKIPLNVDPTIDRSTGGLELSLASTLIPQLTAPARQVLAQDPLPLLELTASRLAIAANLQTLSKTYSTILGDFKPSQDAALSLERLQSLQREDGGFAYYPQSEASDPFVTPYAASAIAQATNAGFTVKGSVSTRLTTYLQKLLANPAKDDFCTETICQNRLRLAALVALAELGNPRTDFLSTIYEGRSNLTFLEQVRLARHLSRFPDWQAKASNLFQQLQETIADTGRAATVTLSSDNWWWLSSSTAAQAEALRLAIAQKADATSLARLVQGLLNQQRQGTWANTYDTAQALTALVAYTRLQPTPPNFSVNASLAGKPVTSAQFQGYQTPNVEAAVPMAALPTGSNDLVLDKSGNGTLHYRVAFNYRLQGNPPGRFNGLRVLREVRPANQDRVIASYGLPAAAPVTVPASQVYDVGIQIITDKLVDHVLITDPLPAGFEAVDSSFQTSTPYFQAKGDDWQISYQEIHSDRIVAYADRLEPGIYTLHYLVRSVTPGTFLWSGTEAHLQYAPDQFGRTATSTLVVAPQ